MAIHAERCEIWALPAGAMKQAEDVSRTGIIDVLIVEPEPGRCEELVTYLSSEAEIRIVGAGEDFLYVSQIPTIRRRPVDVLLINIDQPEMAQIDTWAAIHVVLPRARIAALTAGNDDRVLEMALGAGVGAYGNAPYAAIRDAYLRFTAHCRSR